MSAAEAAPEVVRPPRETYLNAELGVKSWLLTKDHKRIGLLYLASITLFFFLASPDGHAARHYRLLAHLAGRFEEAIEDDPDTADEVIDLVAERMLRDRPDQEKTSRRARS